MNKCSHLTVRDHISAVRITHEGNNATHKQTSFHLKPSVAVGETVAKCEIRDEIKRNHCHVPGTSVNRASQPTSGI